MIEGMIQDILGGDIFKNATKILTKSPFDYPAVNNIITTIYDIAMSIGIYLLIIYFLLKLVDIMSSENFTWEQLWKQMASFIAAKVLMEYGLDIIKLMFTLGALFMESVQITVTSGAANLPTAAALKSALSKSLGLTGFMKILEGVIMFVYLLVPWILSWLLGMGVKIVCYSRLIEISVRAAFAPIALSDFFHSGLQSGGWRFLKNFLAVCLQGALILGVSMLYSAFFADVINSAAADPKNIMAITGLMIAFGASAVMLTFKTLPLAKELVGSNN